MDFSGRSMQASAPARPAANGEGPRPAAGGKSKAWKNNPMWMRIVWVVLLFGGTALVVSIVFLLYFGGAKETNYVSTGQEQAVFLTNGQVYFGQIKAINKDYIDLQNIYYLNVNQQVQPNQSGSSASNSTANQSVSLVKLGCELHGPTDQMLINRDQVTFWENLKSTGQVSKAITQWLQQNPKGQDCTQTTPTTSSSSSSTKP